MCECGCTPQCYICHTAYTCNGRFRCDTCPNTSPACGMYSILRSQCVDCFKRALLDVDSIPPCTIYEDIVELTLRKLEGKALEVYSEVASEGSQLMRQTHEDAEHM